MAKLRELITAMQLLLLAAAPLRALYCVIMMAMNEDEYQKHKQRLKTLVVFVVVSECASGLLAIVLNYIT